MILVKIRLSLPYAQIPFVTIISLMSVLYVAGLFGILLQISWFAFLTGLISFTLSLYNIVVGAQWRTFYRRLAYNNEFFPLVAFGILLLTSWFVFKNNYITRWDEFSFWSIFTKIATNYNGMIAGFNDINKADYPRISSILQYYFILFLNRGDFHEGTAIFAQVTLFSSAVPVFLSIRKYSILLLVPIACCFYCLFYLFAVPVSSLYNDSVLALCWGMSMILYLINENRTKSLIITSIGLFVMVQVKEMGLVFAFCTIFIVMIDEAFFYRVKLPVKLKRLGVLTAVVLVSYTSWNLFTSFSGVTQASFNLDRFEGSLFDLKSYQKTTAKNFLYSLTLSPLYWTITFVVFMSLSCFLVGNSSHKIFDQKSRGITLTLCLLAVLSGHACLLLFLYLFAFSPWEAVRLASFERYLGTAYLGAFLVLFYFVLGTEKKTLLLAFFVPVFLFTPASVLEPFVPRHKNEIHKYLDDLYGKIDPAIEAIKREGGEPRIMLINQGGRGSFYVKFKSRAFPLKFEPLFSVNTEEKDNWPPETRIVSAEDFGRILQKCDYLIVWNDAEFWELYGDEVKSSKLKAVWKLADDLLVKLDPVRL